MGRLVIIPTMFVGGLPPGFIYIFSYVHARCQGIEGTYPTALCLDDVITTIAKIPHRAIPARWPSKRRVDTTTRRLHHSWKRIHIARWTHRPTYIRISVPYQMYAYRTMDTSTDVHTYFLEPCQMYAYRTMDTSPDVHTYFSTLPNVCISHDGHIDRRTYLP